MSTMLTPDAPVPALSVKTVGGDTWDLAPQKPENVTMVAFYRGLHCPVCKAYLQKLEGLLAGYEEAGFSTIAISMNPEDLAKQSADEWELSKLTIGYGLSEADARAWGLYISKAIKDGEADIFCEPGLFWVRPDGRLYLADVSNMPWARPDLEFLQSKIPFAVENKYPARGGH
mgnify:FL=1